MGSKFTGVPGLMQLGMHGMFVRLRSIYEKSSSGIINMPEKVGLMRKEWDLKGESGIEKGRV